MTANKPDLTIVATRSYDTLYEQVASCRKRMLVASPYVNKALTDLTKSAHRDIAKTLITRTDLRGFAAGVSSLETLLDAVGSGWSVHSLAGLHAKLYVFDDSFALVTSANATMAGLRRNIECGLAVTAPDIVARLAETAVGWLSAQDYRTTRSLRDLEELREPVSVYKEFLRSIPQPSLVKATDHEGVPSRVIVDRPALLDAFSGWKKLVLEAMFQIPAETFDLNRLFRICEPVAKIRYPVNRNVRAKIRQQLQTLRDLGLVEFRGHGIYQKTFAE